jgi:hypothetical protein
MVVQHLLQGNLERLSDLTQKQTRLAQFSGKGGVIMARTAMIEATRRQHVEEVKRLKADLVRVTEERDLAHSLMVLYGKDGYVKKLEDELTAIKQVVGEVVISIRRQIEHANFVIPKRVLQVFDKLATRLESIGEGTNPCT